MVAAFCRGGRQRVLAGVRPQGRGFKPHPRGPNHGKALSEAGIFPSGLRRFFAHPRLPAGPEFPVRVLQPDAADLPGRCGSACRIGGRTAPPSQPAYGGRGAQRPQFPPRSPAKGRCTPLHAPGKRHRGPARPTGTHDRALATPLPVAPAKSTYGALVHITKTGSLRGITEASSESLQEAIQKPPRRQPQVSPASPRSHRKVCEKSPKYQRDADGGSQARQMADRPKRVFFPSLVV
jgi:hypothetical protein